MNRDDTVLSSAGRRFDDDSHNVGPLVAIEILLEPRRPVAELLQLELGVLAQIGGRHEQPEAWFRFQRLVEQSRRLRHLGRAEKKKRKRKNE
jgi:hypothetical protein